MNSTLKAINVGGVILFVLIVLAVVLLFCLIVPIWSLIECLTAKTKSDKAKIIWGIVILLSWSLGGVIYGSLFAKSRTLRVLSRVSFAVLFVSGVLFVVFMPYAEKERMRSIENHIVQVERLKLSGISEKQRFQFKASLETLKQETDKPWYRNLDKKLVMWDLEKLVGIYLKDNQLTDKEYEDWMAKFNSRDVLDRKELEKYLRQLNR